MLSSVKESVRQHYLHAIRTVLRVSSCRIWAGQRPPLGSSRTG